MNIVPVATADYSNEVNRGAVDRTNIIKRDPVLAEKVKFGEMPASKAIKGSWLSLRQA